MKTLLLSCIALLAFSGCSAMQIFLKAPDIKRTTLAKEIAESLSDRQKEVEENKPCGKEYLLWQKELLEKGSSSEEFKNAWQKFFECIDRFLDKKNAEASAAFKLSKEKQEAIDRFREKNK